MILVQVATNMVLRKSFRFPRWFSYEFNNTRYKIGVNSLIYTFQEIFGEGNGNPLQCSCLENPRDGGAWWAAVYGVAQSRTRLKRLSSSSSSPRTATATPRGNITKQNDTNINRFLNRHRFCWGLLYPFFFFFLKLTIFSRR